MTSPPDGPEPPVAERRPDGRRERWRQHREHRRRELVRAVVAAVRDLGPDIGMEGIAAHAGIPKQVFYRYFADKADLQQSVGRTLARTVVVDVQASVESQSSPRAMLASGIARYLELIDENPHLYRYVSQRPGGGGDDLMEDFTGVIGVQLARLLGDRLRAAGLDAGAAEPWAFALVGSVRSAADRWLRSPTQSRRALADYLTEFAWRGLSVIDDEARPTLRPVRRQHPAGDRTQVEG